MVESVVTTFVVTRHNSSAEATSFCLLVTAIAQPLAMFPLSLPPPPGFGSELVSIDSLEAALGKMGIKVSMQDLISAIRDIEKAKSAKLIADWERCAVFSKCKSPATVARLLSFTPVQYASTNLLYSSTSNTRNG